MTAASSASAQSTAQPGEFIHYFTNLLRLFRRTHSVARIERDARAAVSLREARMQGFTQRLESVRQHFELTRGAEKLPPRLRGWDVERIERIRREHGGLLIAVFHYGEHRQVLSDLCCLGIPFVAPIAKRSYFDATAVFANGPPECAAAPLLLEVERPSVGRHLVTALKRGRIGVIYVDGNMGPDGHLVEESATDVRFLDERIRVKCGIARLALALNLPVLPLIAAPRAELPMVADHLLAFPEILPASDASADYEARIGSIMQTCYDALAAAVAKAPEQWEFAFCLHRWLHVDAEKRAAPQSVSESDAIAIDPSVVVHYPRADGVFWLNVVSQRGFRLPPWAADLYAFLSDAPRAAADIAAHLRAGSGSAEEIDALLAHLRAADLISAVAPHSFHPAGMPASTRRST